MFLLNSELKKRSKHMTQGKDGLTIREAAKELQLTQRSIYRLIGDKTLLARKVSLPYAKPVWMVDRMSVARFKLRKEMGLKQNP